MIPSQQKIQFSNYSGLYDIIIPEDHKLRKINELIDFNFIMDALKSKYCEDNGRTAIDPIMMFKYLMLKVIYNLSDIDVVEHSRYDMSFKYFLGMMPEDDVINPSSLCKFRKFRLKDMNLMNMLIGKTVGIAIEHGLIKSGTIIVDATHSLSRSNPEAAVDHLKQYVKMLKEAAAPFVSGTSINLQSSRNTKNNLDKEIRNSEELLSSIRSEPRVYEIPAVKEKCNLLSEKIEDAKEYAVLSMDGDARIGHKSVEDSFFGYKTHIAMSPERFIVAATVTSGEKSDGKELPEILAQTEANGVTVDTIVGDGAYSGYENLKLAEEKDIDVIARINPVITNGTRHDEELESLGIVYNKDAGTYQCRVGKLAHKRICKRNNLGSNDYIRYEFRGCDRCQFNSECMKRGTKSKSISVRLGLKQEHLKQLELEKTDRYKRLARERYKIEAKNAELKNVLGYKRAISYGLEAMRLQGAVTLFVANLKRIIKIEG